MRPRPPQPRSKPQIGFSSVAGQSFHRLYLHQALRIGFPWFPDVYLEDREYASCLGGGDGRSARCWGLVCCFPQAVLEIPAPWPAACDLLLHYVLQDLLMITTSTSF